VVDVGPLDCMQPRGGLRAHAAAAKMRTDVTGAGLVLTKTLRGEVRRRVLLAMSRFGPGIQGVAVRLAESQNPLGGVDRRCRVRARLRSGVLLQAEAVNGELEEAIGRSTARLARLVAIALDGSDGRVGQAPAGRPPRSQE
jgi:ribosome-associated translation inhibitor RaiA